MRQGARRKRSNTKASGRAVLARDGASVRESLRRGCLRPRSRGSATGAYPWFLGSSCHSAVARGAGEWSQCVRHPHFPPAIVGSVERALFVLYLIGSFLLASAFRGAVTVFPSLRSRLPLSAKSRASLTWATLCHAPTWSALLQSRAHMHSKALAKDSNAIGDETENGVSMRAIEEASENKFLIPAVGSNSAWKTTPLGHSTTTGGSFASVGQPDFAAGFAAYSKGDPLYSPLIAGSCSSTTLSSVPSESRLEGQGDFAAAQNIGLRACFPDFTADLAPAGSGTPVKPLGVSSALFLATASAASSPLVTSDASDVGSPVATPSLHAGANLQSVVLTPPLFLGASSSASRQFSSSSSSSFAASSASGTGLIKRHHAASSSSSVEADVPSSSHAHYTLHGGGTGTSTIGAAASSSSGGILHGGYGVVGDGNRDPISPRSRGSTDGSAAAFSSAGGPSHVNSHASHASYLSLSGQGKRSSTPHGHENGSGLSSIASTAADASAVAASFLSVARSLFSPQRHAAAPVQPSGSAGSYHEAAHTGSVSASPDILSTMKSDLELDAEAPLRGR